MHILIIGGTRNLGHLLTLELLRRGHRVTIFNRGRTRDELPESVERLRGDRTQLSDLAAALRGRTFDAVVDTTLYKEDDAKAVVQLLNGRTGHYLFLSSGQVYLVREGAERPFHEDEYAGRVMPPPKPETYEYEEWLYGIDKRRCEDVLFAAYDEAKFPFTTLRLPMVNGERDHFNRFYNYYIRLNDGGPILAPETPKFPLRHVYSGDVVRLMAHLLETGLGKGRVYNVSQNETLTLEEFLTLAGELMGVEARVIRVSRELLNANGFLPDCSPFSERWMSELDNTRSKQELGMVYTPVRDYLAAIIAHFRDTPPPRPASYKRRHSELTLIETMR